MRHDLHAQLLATLREFSDGCDGRNCMCECHDDPLMWEPPTFSMQPVPGQPGVVRPVLAEPPTVYVGHPPADGDVEVDDGEA